MGSNWMSAPAEVAPETTESTRAELLVDLLLLTDALPARVVSSDFPSFRELVTRGSRHPGVQL